MSKTTAPYWNPLAPQNRSAWQPVEGLEGMAEEITLAIDEDTGDYTRITRFLPGADTTLFGSKVHSYPEEILVLEGSLFDAAFDRWLASGEYAGPRIRIIGCRRVFVAHPRGRGAAC